MTDQGEARSAEHAPVSDLEAAKFRLEQVIIRLGARFDAGRQHVSIGSAFAGEIIVACQLAALSLSLRADGEEKWRRIEGVPRDELPGTLMVWIIGGTEHSDASWRREGMAIVTLQSDGPFGFDPDGLKAARKRLDMQWIDKIELYRPLPSPPSLPLKG